MRYRLLGKSGLRVSELCLGTMTFGEDWGWGSSKDESKVIFERFLDSGGNFVDTANIYTNGASESFLGEFMQGRRDRIVLATKYTNAMPSQDPNASGNGRKSMIQAVEASLKRLKTDYIDLFWLHIWDQITPIEEVMRAFDDLVKQGKVLHIGISDAPAWVISKANVLAELRGWTPFIGLQIEYNLLERTPERELLPMAKDFNLGVTAWSPLASGALTGKYSQKGSEGSRLHSEQMKEFKADPARTEKVVAELKTVAKEIGVSEAQTALAWIRQRSLPVIPIIGARKLSQLEDNLACLKVTLSPAQIERLDKASQIELGFPHEFYERQMVRDFVYGGLRDSLEV